VQVTVVFAARQIHSPRWGVQVCCQPVASAAFATALTPACLPRLVTRATWITSDIGVFATARMRSNCGMIIHLYPLAAELGRRGRRRLGRAVLPGQWAFGQGRAAV